MQTTAFNVTFSTVVVAAISGTPVANNVVAGANFNLTVEARDANDNLAENFTGSFTLNANAPDVGARHQQREPGQGRHHRRSEHAGPGRLHRAEHQQRRQRLPDHRHDHRQNPATGAAGVGVQTTAFNVTFSTVVVAAISGTPVANNVVAGANFNLTVEARDANGNLAENFTGSFTLNADAPDVGARHQQ